MRLRVTTRAIDEDRPLLDLAPTRDALAWVSGGEGLVGWGQAARITPGPQASRITDADAALRALDAEVDDEVGLPGSGLVALGSFTFSTGTPGSTLTVPRRLVGRRDGVTFRTDVEALDAPAGDPAADPVPEPADAPLPTGPRDRPRYAGSSNPELHWLEAVATAIDRVEAGEVEKVVLARDHALWAHHPFDPLDLARRLTARFPSCHAFLVDGLVGATPELLVARFGERVASRALAGTTGRGATDADDAALGEALLASDKDQREHELAVRSVEEVLRPRCASLQVDRQPRLLRLDNVQHLATGFDGRLAGGDTSLSLAAALHPTAAVGGTPREPAVAMLESLEGMDRGRYAAPVGWTDADGDGEWGIALRCAELSGARARLFAGVGIVAGSLPEAELEETRLKLRAMQAVLGEEPSA